MSTDGSPSILDDPKNKADILYILRIFPLRVWRQMAEKTITVIKHENGTVYIEIKNRHLAFVGADMKERPAGDLLGMSEQDKI